MKKNDVINLEKYAECSPRCYSCDYYERHMGTTGNRFVPYCNAKFNQGDLIFKETIDICADNNAFKQK